MRKIAIITCLVLGSALAFTVMGGEKVSAEKHPNLAAAQKLLEKAINKTTEAQKANEYDMDGHAAKAKELMNQAFVEIKKAAEMANKNKK